jgi:protein CpxP
MKRLSKISMLAVAVLMAGAVAVPFALSQSAGNGANNQQEKRMERRADGKFRGRRGAGMHRRWLSRLNLTEAQKEQMKRIGQSYRERTQSLRQELQAKRQELRQAQASGAFNESLATQKLTEMAAPKAKLMGEQFKLRQEMLAVLTPEQKAQLEQLREQFKSRREQFRSKQSERRADQAQ